MTFRFNWRIAITLISAITTLASGLSFGDTLSMPPIIAVIAVYCFVMMLSQLFGT